jgi:hypothetical protein
VTSGWQRKFEDPIPLPNGKKLATLRDAADYITSQPKKESEFSVMARISAIDRSRFPWMTMVRRSKRALRYSRLRFPHPRSNHALGTMNEGFFYRHHQRQPRHAIYHFHSLTQPSVAHDPSTAANSQRLALVGHQENQPYFGFCSTFRKVSARRFPRCSGIAIVRSSSTYTNAAGSPFGETSRFPAASEDATITNGDRAMKARQIPSRESKTLASTFELGLPITFSIAASAERTSTIAGFPSHAASHLNEWSDETPAMIQCSI